jgi:hypothetical protein
MYEFSAGDTSDYAPLEYFWDRESLDEGVAIKSGQFWMPLPDTPKER